MTENMVLCPSCKSRKFTQDAPWKLLCVKCYLERNPNKRRTSELVVPSWAAIEPEMLRRLIQLCHPDRHYGSEASTTATAYLLALKKGAAHL